MGHLARRAAVECLASTVGFGRFVCGGVAAAGTVLGCVSFANGTKPVGEVKGHGESISLFNPP